jgi:hypothetical protein
VSARASEEEKKLTTMGKEQSAFARASPGTRELKLSGERERSERKRREELPTMSNLEPSNERGEAERRARAVNLRASEPSNETGEAEPSPALERPALHTSLTLNAGS